MIKFLDYQARVIIALICYFLFVCLFVFVILAYSQSWGKPLENCIFYTENYA